MSAWATPLSRALDEFRDEFGITAISHPEQLEQCLQTGFVWTHQAGIACLAINRQYFHMATTNPDVCVIIAPSTATDGSANGRCVITCVDAESLYLHLHATQLGDDDTDNIRVDPSAHVDASAILRGKIDIGSNVHIGPRVVICGPTRIETDAWIEPGAIIGADGLYAKTLHGIRRHIPHFGGVTISEHAFIHAGAIIVRSAIKGESTRIGARAHIGIMTNIGHDATVAEDATISSHCVIAGRAHIGAAAWIGASATVSNMVHIGDRAKVRLGAVVIRDVPADADVSGNFAVDHARTLRKYLKDSGHAT